ncbi:NTP transferase domain-containing protein [Candidatus Saccharibacteria bacterium]|nr:NTP transferase domain-containing protein [Candidatus Saccharibacteria bacterium]
MMSNKTVIISCAGMGTRLGAGKPKALIDIDGKPLIIRTLEMLNDVDDIRVVVGYQAERVIEVVKNYRRDVVFVYNHGYQQNGTGASVSLAKKYSRKYILTIDGDILIHPDDMKEILLSETEFVGVCKPSTDDPVLVGIKDNKVTNFYQENGPYEWTGVTMLESRKLTPTDGHVLHLVEQVLPLGYKIIREREIDTPNDYKNAIIWVENGYKD